MKPLSIDLRERAMARLDAGETVRDVGEALSVASSTVVKWSLRRRATGRVAPAKIGGNVARKIDGDQEAWLRARMAAGPFTLRELVVERAERDLRADYRTMWKFAPGAGLSFKKKPLWLMSRIARIWPASACAGRHIRALSIRNGLCSLTKHGPRPT